MLLGYNQCSKKDSGVRSATCVVLCVRSLNFFCLRAT